jgi:hypothetical protein
MRALDRNRRVCLGLAAAGCAAWLGARAVAADLQGDLIVPATPPAPVATPATAASAPASASNAVSSATTNAVAWSLSDLTKSVVDDSAKRAKDTAGFDKLSAFTFKVSDDMVLGMADAVSTSLDISSQIPASVKALNHKNVTITGFMMPTKVDDGNATEFLLLKNQGLCCYGTAPAMNEYVAVRMAGKGVKPVMDRLITVTGQLRVGEIRENHLLIGIYRLDADKCDLPAE